MNDGNLKTIKIIMGGILFLLFIILAIVVWFILKPPVVTQATIDSLMTSTKETQQYVKELRDLALRNKQKTQEDNNLFHENDGKRNFSYEELYKKYGINTHATNDQTIMVNTPILFVNDRMQFQTKNFGRE